MPYSNLAPRSPHASKRLAFIFGLFQMVLLSSNIRNIANGHVVFGAIFAIVNTYVIVYGVKMSMHSTRWEVFCYAIGSGCGVSLGIMLHHYIVEPHAITHLSSIIGL